MIVFRPLRETNLLNVSIVVDIPPARSSGTPIDYVHAMQKVPLSTLSHRRDVELALADMIPDPKVRGFLVTNITSRPEGLTWIANLDVIERYFDQILDLMKNFLNTLLFPKFSNLLELIL